MPCAPRGPYICAWCGIEYKTTRPKGEGETYCTRACSYEHQRIVGRPWRRKPVQMAISMPCKCGAVLSSVNQSGECGACGYVRKQLRIALQRTDKHCAVCNVPFNLGYGYGNRKTCSAHCARQLAATHRERARRVGKGVRRARIRAAAAIEAVDPMSVFKRDGWKCKGCGCDTPMALRGTDSDDAPEMDHIVSLSKGGTHTHANCQCLCRVCNRLKADKEWEPFVAWVRGYGPLETLAG